MNTRWRLRRGGPTLDRLEFTTDQEVDMPTRPWMLALLVIGSAAVLLPRPAEAQWTRRIRGAAKRTVEATKETAEKEALREVDGLLGEAAAAVVEDGRFTAVVSPWVSEDGQARAEYARVSGVATVTGRGGVHTILLCDDGGRQWRATFTMRGDQESRTARSSADDGTTSASLAAADDYALPSDRVSVAVRDDGAIAGHRAEGSLRIASVSDDVWVGAANLTFARVSLPGEAEPTEVEFATTFRARPPQEGEASSCGGRPAPTRR